MIIAAYAGVGKSAFAAQTENALDLPIMPYRWILPPADKAPVEPEGEKGALYRLADPRFPGNYLAEILKAERTLRFVLIPTNNKVIRRLQEDYGRKVLLCCPDDSCREEYRTRFIARGNSESFLDLFIGGWDHILGPLRENKQGTYIAMCSGQYLSDLQQRFEKERRIDTTTPISEETIRALEEEAAAYRKSSALCLYGCGDCCIYPITDLDAPEEREFLHQIGRMVYDSGIYPMVASNDWFRETCRNVFLTQDREEVRTFIARISFDE